MEAMTAPQQGLDRGSVPKRNAELPDVADRLAVGAEKLHALLDNLTGRLEPVMRSADVLPTAAVIPELPPAMTKLGDALRQSSLGVEGACERVISLIERLEV